MCAEGFAEETSKSEKSPKSSNSALFAGVGVSKSSNALNAEDLACAPDGWRAIDVGPDVSRGMKFIPADDDPPSGAGTSFAEERKSSHPDIVLFCGELSAAALADKGLLPPNSRPPSKSTSVAAVLIFGTNLLLLPIDELEGVLE